MIKVKEHRKITPDLHLNDKLKEKYALKRN